MVRHNLSAVLFSPLSRLLPVLASNTPLISTQEARLKGKMHNLKPIFKLKAKEGGKHEGKS